MIPPRLKTKTVRHKGRGVFTNYRIRKGEIIEIVPVIILSQREAKILKNQRRSIYNYCYTWGRRGNQTALALGHGSFINHSYNPNAEYYPRLKRKELVFRALRDIAPGEEITHNYNGSPNDKRPIRFTKNSWEHM